MTLGDKIRKAMEDAELSRSEFASAIGVSNATLTRWFKNQNPPSDQHFVMICKITNKKRQWFFDGTATSETIDEKMKALEDRINRISFSPVDLSKKVIGLNVSYSDVLYKLQTAPHSHIEAALYFLFEDPNMISDDEIRSAVVGLKLAE